MFRGGKKQAWWSNSADMKADSGVTTSSTSRKLPMDSDPPLLFAAWMID
jgi:hypothetical protein